MIPKQPHYVPPPYQDSATRGRLILRDGTTATIHVASPREAPDLAAFFKRLSSESRRSRFFTDSKPGQSDLERMCDDQDPHEVLTMIVNRIAGGEQRIIATGSYFRSDDTTAEVALTVEDAFQGKGLGTLILERLALLAIRHGFTKFKAITDAGNKAMLEVFRHSGFPVSETYSDGFINVEFSVLPGADSVARTELRDRLFTAASMRPFFAPRALAVVGVGNDSSLSPLATRIIEQCREGGFQGRIYPIGSGAAEIDSLPVYSSVGALPEPAELAVLAVPREEVLDAVTDCAQGGVRAVIVIADGFADANDDEGRALQDRVLEQVRGYGMRMIGPNCLGLLNLAPDIAMNASFSSVVPSHGTVSMSSESGALGLALLAQAKRLHVGLSTFVSIGNKADVSGNDLLQYWEGDDTTHVILLYMESIKNPRRFARIARRVSRSKPIICVKSARTTAGRRAAGPHTAPLLPADSPVDALFHQTGVLRCNTLAEMFDLAAALSRQPLPAGERAAIITNARGPGILIADTCEANGLSLSELSDSTREQLRMAGFDEATAGNPVTLPASVCPRDYRHAAEIVLLDDNVDMLIMNYIPLGVVGETEIRDAMAEGIANARRKNKGIKPVLVCLMSAQGDHAPISLDDRVSLPVYAYPESAARVMGKMAAYAAWLRQPAGMIPDFTDIEPARARAICQHALATRGPGSRLTAEETRDVLQSFNLPVNAEGAAPDEAHVEVMVGVTNDPLFGPLLAFGLGGVHVEILGDVCFRVTPLTDQDADMMVREIRGYRLLEGYRGHLPADVEAIKEVLLRVSLLVEDVPEIVELNMNPIFALEPGKGCRIVDAQITVEPDIYRQPTRTSALPG